MKSDNDLAVILPLHYLPNLEYFACLQQFDTVWIESCENYTRQTLRNRCYVLTANGVAGLSVPVLKQAPKMLVRDVRIDYGQDWLKRHWGCLVAAYAKSPFFEYYAPDFKAVFDSKPVFLFDLNERFLTLCLKLLKSRKELKYNLSYQKEVNFPVFDARSCITDKKGVNTYSFYQEYPYYQTFGNDFVRNLSIVDLLFNLGPQGPEVLMKSVKKLSPEDLNEA